MPSRRSFLTKAAWLAAGAGAVWYARDKILWAAPQPAFASGGASGWLPFARPRYLLPTLKVTVQGRQINALLDSGAQYSAVDRRLAQSLGLKASFAPLIAVGVSGEPQLGRGVALDVAAGGLTLSRLKAAVLDLGPITDSQGLSAPLILGQDVLGQLIADIDFPRRRLLLAGREDHRLPAGALPAPTVARGRALAAQVTVGGTPLEVIVDTGASVVLALARDVAETVGLLAGQRPRTAASIVLGGQLSGQVVRASEVTFAGVVYEDVDVMIYERRRLPGFPRGLLGAGALGRFRVILDHAGGAMHLADGATPA